MSNEKIGDRIELISTTDVFTNLKTGERGTVALIDSLGTIHVDWDNGNRLGLIPGEDKWKIIGYRAKPT